jgi:peroxiredoxin
MKPFLLALALFATAAAQAQTHADSLLLGAFQSVVAGPAFSFGFELRIQTPDTVEVVPGQVLTFAMPPDGRQLFRLSYSEGEAVTLAFDGEVFEYASPRTQKVYADSSGAEAEGLAEGYLPLLAYHPTLGLNLHDDLAGAGDGALLSKGAVIGRPCTRASYSSIPAEGLEPELPAIDVCYDDRTRLPLSIDVSYPSRRSGFNLSLTSLKRVPVPRAGAFSLGTPEGWSRTNYSGGDGNPLQVGETAPDFALQTEDGDTVRLADLRGQTVVLDFWGTWCAPCVRALPAMGDLAEAQSEVTFLGLASYESEDADPEAFARERGVGYPVLLAETETLEAYRIYAFPTYIVVGPDGTILYHDVHDADSDVDSEVALAAFLSRL